jgi:predicted RNase H-like nuclease (RuvC/YqgF family)
MRILKKQNKVVTPEVKIQEADIQIEAQKDQFRKLAQEVEYGMSLRSEAISELETEIETLKIKLENKQKQVEVENDKFKMDEAYLGRVQQFIG